MRRPESFEEFWPFYVSQHQNKRCRQLHFIGTSIAIGCVAISPWYPQALIVAPIAGYGLSWIGHFMFEKNRPASWGGLKELAWSLRSDLRMWQKMLDGTMDADVAKLVPAYEAARAAAEAAEAADAAAAAGNTSTAAAS